MNAGATLVLVRHGRTAQRAPAALIDAAGIDAHRRAEDAAGILQTSEPPPALVALAARADFIVASDLARAIASAERLAPGRARISPLFREAPLAIPAIPLRLPFAGWQVLVHAAWVWRILRRRDANPAERARAAAAADWLEALVIAGGTALVLTHGVFRRLLALELTARGWRFAPGPRSYANWSAWVLERGGGAPPRDD